MTDPEKVLASFEDRLRKVTDQAKADVRAAFDEYQRHKKTCRMCRRSRRVGCAKARKMLMELAAVHSAVTMTETLMR